MTAVVIALLVTGAVLLVAEAHVASYGLLGLAGAIVLAGVGARRRGGRRTRVARTRRDTRSPADASPQSAGRLARAHRPRRRRAPRADPGRGRRRDGRAVARPTGVERDR